MLALLRGFSLYINNFVILVATLLSFLSLASADTTLAGDAGPVRQSESEISCMKDDSEKLIKALIRDGLVKIDGLGDFYLYHRKQYHRKIKGQSRSVLVPARYYLKFRADAELSAQIREQCAVADCLNH